MKKSVIIFMLAMVCISSVLAFSVQKTDVSSVIVKEAANPAIYNFTITTGYSGSAELYSIVGIDLLPRGAFEVSAGVNNIEVRAFPADKYREQMGNFVVEYYLKGSEPLFKDNIAFRVVSIKDVLKVNPSNLHPDDSFLNLSITNSENVNLENIDVTLDSEFFTTSKKMTIKPYETISIILPVDKTKTAKLTAGRYMVSAKIETENSKIKLDGIINYLEKQGTSLVKSSEGYIIRKTIVTKKNEGNTIVQDNITLNKDAISRLFTSFSVSPSKVVRKGLSTEYTWNKQLLPSESWGVSTTTNYTLPFLFLILIIVISFLVKIYYMSALSITKRCSYVKTKGGQFALKVSVSIKAKTHVDKVQVIDLLPGMTKLYEHFGVKPSKIEPGTRRLFWNIDHLQSGEERIFSYIIYTTVNVVGRFELPSATVIYEKEGKTHELLSNRAFFMSETSAGD